jgi:hypothetical protein
MSECSRKTCKLSGDPIPSVTESRCGNCDHHASLHFEDGCCVQIQPNRGNKNTKCPCGWNAYQATDVPCMQEAFDSDLPTSRLHRFLQSCDRCGREAADVPLNVLCDRCMTVCLAEHLVDDILLPVSVDARSALIDMLTASLNKFASIVST